MVEEIGGGIVPQRDFWGALGRPAIPSPILLNISNVFL